MAEDLARVVGSILGSDSGRDVQEDEVSESSVIKICGQEVTDFSSQYGGETRLSYSAANLAGKTNIYPSYGDYTQACVFRTYGPWWKIAPSAPKPYIKTPSSFCSEDYIELTFEEKLYPVAVKIYETYNPGAIVKILATDYHSGSSVDTGKTRWVTLWSSPPAETPQRSRIFSPPIKKIDFPINMVRLELCHALCDYYTELDCVLLCGTRMGPESLTDSSGDQVQDVVSSLKSLTVDDYCACGDGDGDYPRLFERLPGEVILLILSYFDITSLCRLAQTCRLLRDYCYDHLLYTELNLQPLWQQASDVALDGLSMRCRHLQRLNLSWCGKAAPITNDCLDRFLQEPKAELTCLQLSCCPFVNNETLRLIATHCPELKELDLSSCEQVDKVAALQLLLLRKLERLNLYRTKIDIHSIVCVIRELGTHCRKLRTLDMWRARSLQDDGLVHLANNCSQLEELDVGWCTELRSQSGCFVNLAEKCKNLKKLFLTANRTVCDLDLLALAKHSLHLQQLDILGTREVSSQAAERVMANCKELVFFDVSFCAGITDATVEHWKKQYPHVSVKKSFQHS
ncbi:hypothetical protein BaRGS_00035303 [Batillaria attramentaria]|uniref:F-box domain-containing protein n=1 Tax=Batillaria attramentaria TaxID=370345 RepID=A0ABD0JFD7_9CAEN